jgi:23S rRNA pseudouridine2457 synthase
MSGMLRPDTCDQASGRPATLLILFNKPFGVLCQFRDAQKRAVLADFIDVPGVYPAGRLDRDSEGLLLLTDDGGLQHRLSDPRHKVAKTYLVQVEGVPGCGQLESLRAGVRLNDGASKPARVSLLAAKPSLVWPRDPPIRKRQNKPTQWLELTISEGRNRQVRRMTAAVNLPTLRLIRTKIGPYQIEKLAPGQWRKIEPVVEFDSKRPFRP